MDESIDRQRVIDEEHLRLLSFFHYISGALTLLVSSVFIFQFFLFSVIYDEIMIEISDYTMIGNYDLDPQIFSFLIYLWIILFLIFIIFGIAQILSGKFIKAKKYRIFSFIVAVLNILSFPYGTILGVMTIIVLSRSSVIELYQ
jgi:hypothetical protein